MDNTAMAKFSASDEDNNNKKIKSVPRRLRNRKTEVRNVARTHHIIVFSIEKTIVTPQGRAK